MHYIYLIKNNINKKHYVGQSILSRNRWKNHQNNTKRVLRGAKLKDSGIQVVHLAMAKHGINNFSFYILEECDYQDIANEREKHWIMKLDSINYGYNCQPGGKVVSGTDHHGYGKPRSAETKKKISKALMGRGLSEEHKRAISYHAKKRVGKLNHFYGKTHSEEVKKHLSNLYKGTESPMAGKKHTVASRKKMSNFRKGRPSFARRLTNKQVKNIRKLNQEGISMRELAVIYNCSKSNIHCIITKKTYKEIK